MSVNKENILKYRMLNLSLLIAALFIITVWAGRHFENSWLFVTLANLFTVILGVGGFVLKASTDEEEGVIKDKVRSLLMLGLNPVVLFVLYAFIVCVGNFLTTVTVYGEATDRGSEVRLTREGSSRSGRTAKLEDDEATAHFFALTNPFGMLYSLDVSGYVKHSFELFPWTGSRIRVSDLQPVPTMFFRLGSPPQFFNHGKFEIVVGRDTIVAAIGNNNRGALMLGKRIALPQSWKESWDRELDRDNPESGEMATAAKANILSGWNKFVLLDTVSYFSQGALMTVRFLNAEGVSLGSLEVVMSQDPMQDYLIPIQ